MSFSGHIRWKATAAVLCTILFLAGVFLFWGIKSRQGDLQRLILENQSRIHALIRLGTDSTFKQYQFRIEQLLRSRPEMVKAFAGLDRALLLEQALPLYEEVLKRENPLFYDLHFYTPDNKSFLALRNSAPAGDDPAETGAMVAACNHSLRQVSGYDTAGEGVFYRVVQPVMNDGEHVGCVAFGIEVQGVVDLIGEESRVEMATILSREQWKASSIRQLQHTVELNNFTIIKSRKNIFDRLPEGFDPGNFGRRMKINDLWYVFDSYQGLRNHQGNSIANVAFALNVSDFVQEYQQFLLFSVILTAVVVILALIILHFGFGFLLNELYVVNDSLASSKEELEKYRSRLEEIIVERTLDLARSNEELHLEIQQRKKAEDDLLSSERSLAKAQAIARLGHWEWEVEHDRLHCSAEACRLFGLDCSQQVFVLEDICANLLPLDHDRVLSWLAGIRQAPAPGSIDFRVVDGSGEERVIHVEAELVEEKDQPRKIICIAQDVTERRFADKQLLLSASVFENSIEGIIITDAEGNIQNVNRAFSEITGFSEADAVGRNPRILKSDQHDPDFFRGMWESLQSAGLWQGEIWNRRKDGEVYPQWLIITAIKDNQQKTTNYVGVFHDMTEIKLHEEQLRYQAHHDALTGLPNRLLFKDRLGVAMSHAHRFDLKVGVLFLDLDDFKRINDSLGHTVGDYLLQDVAKRLERCLREDDTVARYGGDEFIVLLNELAYEEDAILAAQRILKAISPAICIQNQEFYLTVSMGIAFYPKDGLDQEILIRNADTAMYRAKEAGKNTYQVFTPAMSKKVSEWFAVENSLRKALERQEFFLHYQPKIDVGSGRIAGVEALIRWRHENGEVISPNDFIPLAEDTGLIVEIGEWVLQQACTDVKKLWDKGHPISVSVNISPRQFRQENLPGKVAQVLEKTGLPAEALLLEITEGTVMENEEKSLVLLNTLRDMGVGLSIDDFGTGYSSLYYLKQLPIRELKIDRKFVRDIPKDEDDMAITSAIISMAKSLKLRVVAEGVETDEQMKVLRRRRCDHIQGFLFSRPISEEALHELLDSGKLFDSRQQKGRNQISLPF